jgi:2-dehydropantoate 2-reductase
VKVAVMGTGAMGGYLGARLMTAGADVAFIARGPHLAAIRTEGLRVTSPLGDVHAHPVRATDDPAAVGPADIVLLGVKLYDLEAAVKALPPLLGSGTAVVCLQNGIEAPAIVARHHGEACAVGSVVMINAELIGPGVIKHNALNHLTVGELDGRASPRLEALVALARAAGIEAALSGEIRLELWRKFLLMAPMGALSAMARVELRRIREEPDTWRLAEQGMREVVAVANAEGVALTGADVERTLAFVQGMSAAWKGSLAFDLEQGRRLEVAWLSGAVCRLGEAAGIDTPFHRVALGVLTPHAEGRPAPERSAAPMAADARGNRSS